jgi:hypothetical protein
MAFPRSVFELVLESIDWFAILLQGCFPEKRAREGIVLAVVWW